MKKLLTALLALSLGISLVSCGGGKGNAPAGGTTAPGSNPPTSDSKDVITLKFSTHLPETGVDGASLKYYLDEVSKQSGGKVQFECYFSGSLVKVGDALDAVSTGLTDIQFIPEGFFATQFAPMFVAMQPYMTRSEWVADKALWEMSQTYAPFQEMCAKQGVVNLGTVCPSEVVIVSKKPITSLADLKGLKIRAMGAVNEEMTLLGATPVALDTSELYEALERGTVDAATGIPSTLAISLKLNEVAKYFIFSGRGIYNTSSLYMNKKTYDALPDDVKQAFSTVMDRFLDEYSGDQFMATALKDTVKAVEDAGGTVTALTPEEQTLWAEKLAPMKDSFMKTVTDAGYDGQEILDLYASLVKKYTPDDKAYKPY